MSYGLPALHSLGSGRAARGDGDFAPHVAKAVIRRFQCQRDTAAPSTPGAAHAEGDAVDGGVAAAVVDADAVTERIEDADHVVAAVVVLRYHMKAIGPSVADGLQGDVAVAASRLAAGRSEARDQFIGLGLQPTVLEQVLETGHPDCQQYGRHYDGDHEFDERKTV